MSVFPVKAAAQAFQISYLDQIISENMADCMHFHEGYELVLTIHAQNECFVDNIRYRFEDRTLLLIPPGRIHTIRYRTGSSYVRYVINFSADYCAEALAALGAPELLRELRTRGCQSVQLPLTQFRQLSARFHDLYAAQKNTAPVAVLRAQLCLMLLEAVPILSSAGSMQVPIQTRSDSLVRSVIRHIDTNYAKPIRLEQLAQEFYVSKYHLCHLFREVTGSSIVDYIQCRRVLEAQKLLMQDQNTNAEIADACGFSSMQHFYRVFRKLTGNAPGQYRPSAEIEA